MQTDPMCFPPDMPDEELARLAAQDNGEAFTELIRRMAPLMNRLAAQYPHVYGIGSDDLVQEGLLGLLSAVQAYRPGEGAFSAFASTCIRNRMISALRRHLPTGTYEITDSRDMIADLPSGQADPEQRLMQQEEIVRLRQQLQEALTALEYRVLMGNLSGHSYRQIAQNAGVSEKAVDNALQRVRQKLSSGSFHWFSIWQ